MYGLIQAFANLAEITKTKCINSEMMNKLGEYIDGLILTERVEFIKKTSQSLHVTRKKLDNAIHREGNTPIGTSRAKMTTLYAQSAKLQDEYLGLVEMLKIAIDKI